MKKYTSVLMICARRSVYKLLVVMLLMVVCEGAWYFAQMKDVRYGLIGIYQSLILYGILFLSWESTIVMNRSAVSLFSVIMASVWPEP